MNIRFALLGDAEACNRFYNRIHHANRTVAQWTWEFLPGGFRAGTIPYVVVEDAGRIVGSQAFIPVRMIDATGVFWTAKSEETLLDPNYRGQGLFDKMYKMLFDYLDSNYLHCIWGFTAATKAFDKLGFKTPGTTSQLFFPFSGKVVKRIQMEKGIKTSGPLSTVMSEIGYRAGGTAARLYSTFRFAITGDAGHNHSAPIITRILEHPPAESGDICRDFIRQWGGTTIFRDADYLRWRLYENPYLRAIVRGAYSDNRLLGWVAFTLGDDGIGYLVDIMAVDGNNDSTAAPEVIARLLSDMVVSLRSMGALGVRGWSVNRHPFDRLVTEVAGNLGFLHLKRGHVVVLYLNQKSDRLEPLDQFDNWYVTRVYTEGLAG